MASNSCRNRTTNVVWKTAGPPANSVHAMTPEKEEEKMDDLNDCNGLLDADSYGPGDNLSVLSANVNPAPPPKSLDLKFLSNQTDFEAENDAVDGTARTASSTTRQIGPIMNLADLLDERMTRGEDGSDGNGIGHNNGQDNPNFEPHIDGIHRQQERNQSQHSTLFGRNNMLQQQQKELGTGKENYYLGGDHQLKTQTTTGTNTTSLSNRLGLTGIGTGNITTPYLYSQNNNNTESGQHRQLQQEREQNLKKAENRRLQKRKQHSRDKGQIIKPQDQPGYVGDKEVDDIMKTFGFDQPSPEQQHHHSRAHKANSSPGAAVSSNITSPNAGQEKGVPMESAANAKKQQKRQKQTMAQQQQKKHSKKRPIGTSGRQESYASPEDEEEEEEMDVDIELDNNNAGNTTNIDIVRAETEGETMEMNTAAATVEEEQANLQEKRESRQKEEEETRQRKEEERMKREAAEKQKGETAEKQKREEAEKQKREAAEKQRKEIEKQKNEAAEKQKKAEKQKNEEAEKQRKEEEEKERQKREEEEKQRKEEALEEWQTMEKRQKGKGGGGGGEKAKQQTPPTPPQQQQQPKKKQVWCSSQLAAKKQALQEKRQKAQQVPLIDRIPACVMAQLVNMKQNAWRTPITIKSPLLDDNWERKEGLTPEQIQANFYNAPAEQWMERKPGQKLEGLPNLVLNNRDDPKPNLVLNNMPNPMLNNRGMPNQVLNYRNEPNPVVNNRPNLVVNNRPNQAVNNNRTMPNPVMNNRGMPNQAMNNNRGMPNQMMNNNRGGPKLNYRNANANRNNN